MVKYPVFHYVLFIWHTYKNIINLYGAQTDVFEHSVVLINQETNTVNTVKIDQQMLKVLFS